MFPKSHSHVGSADKTLDSERKKACIRGEIKKAVEDPKVKAEILAESAGVNLGEIELIIHGESCKLFRTLLKT